MLRRAYRAGRALFSRLAGPLGGVTARAGTLRGPYPSWAAAAARAPGYDNAAVLSRVLAASRAVRDGLAAQERDGHALPSVEPSWPLLALLERAALENRGPVHVCDFGGALGSTYQAARAFLPSTVELMWTVVEQPGMVALGQREFSTPALAFVTDVAQVRQDPRVDVLLLSGVLQYLEDPWASWGQLERLDARWLLVDRTPVYAGSQDRVMVQQVSPDIGGGGYPSWVFSEARLASRVRAGHQVISTFDAMDGQWRTPLGMVCYRGMVGVRLRGSSRTT